MSNNAWVSLAFSIYFAVVISGMFVRPTPGLCCSWHEPVTWKRRWRITCATLAGAKVRCCGRPCAKTDVG
jgi:hypothetical protein